MPLQKHSLLYLGQLGYSADIELLNDNARQLILLIDLDAQTLHQPSQLNILSL